MKRKKTTRETTRLSTSFAHFRQPFALVMFSYLKVIINLPE